MAVLSGMNGGIVLAESEAQAYDFINEYAPEHCQILSRGADRHLPFIQTASEILLGEYAASLANYMMGAKLCTADIRGGARWLGVHDFMRTASIGRVDAAGFAEMAPKTEIFTRYEGFDAHANAKLRLPDPRGLGMRLRTQINARHGMRLMGGVNLGLNPNRRQNMFKP